MSIPRSRRKVCQHVKERLFTLQQQGHSSTTQAWVLCSRSVKVTHHPNPQPSPFNPQPSTLNLNTSLTEVHCAHGATPNFAA